MTFCASVVENNIKNVLELEFPSGSQPFPPLAIIILKLHFFFFIRNASMIQSCRSLWNQSKKRNLDRTWAGNPCSLGLVVPHHSLIWAPCWGKNSDTSICSVSAGPPLRAPGYKAPPLRWHSMRTYLLALCPPLGQKKAPATGQLNFLFLPWTVSVHWIWVPGEKFKLSRLFVCVLLLPLA